MHMGQGQTSSDWHVAGHATATVPGAPKHKGDQGRPKGNSHGLAALGCRLSEGVQLAIQGVVSIAASLAPPPNGPRMPTCPMSAVSPRPHTPTHSRCLLLFC